MGKAQILRGRWIALVVGILTSCSGGSNMESPLDGGPSDASAVAIGPQGGTVMGPSGSLVQVPAGALSMPTQIDVQVVSAGYPPLPADLAAAPVYAFLPHGLTFATPVTVRVPYSGIDSKIVGLYTAAPGGQWTKVNGVTIGPDYTETNVTHFSFFANTAPNAQIDAGVNTGPSSGAAGSAAATGVGGAGGVGSVTVAGTGGAGGSANGGAAGAAGSGGSSGTVPPSCVGLAATCGPGGNGDCCAANLVTGGTYNRSNDATYPATVSDFRLDNYEITVGRFRKFVAVYSQTMTADGAGKNPNNPSDPGWNAAWNTSTVARLPADAAALATSLTCGGLNSVYNTWTDSAGGNENLAINCIDWFLAYAFCIWDGGRLPTEAEWNYAAAGGSEQRQYPWGATAPDCSYANYAASVGPGGPVWCTLPGGTNNVGSESPKGDGKWGQSDLAGNLMEWVEDSTEFTSMPVYTNPCDNCSSTTYTGYVMQRGGSFDLDVSYLLSSNRHLYSQFSNAISFGARCARIP